MKDLTLLILTLLILVILLWTTSNTAFAANYINCEKATSDVEKKICSNSKLTKLDLHLNAQYGYVMEGTDRDPDVIRSQKEWLKERNRCADDTCLEKAYQARIFELENNYFAPRLPVVETARRDETASIEDISIKVPYPERWGYFLPEGVATERRISNDKGEYFFPVFWVNKYRRLKSHKDSYVGFFSGLQIETDKRLMGKFNEHILGRSSPDCPLPPQNKELLELSPFCYISFEHALKNGNIIRYIYVVGNLRTDDYDFNERYFQYLGLYDERGRLLKRVTPILLAKQRGIPDICNDFIQTYEVNTHTQSLGDPVWLEDDSFIVSIGSSFVLRLDKNLESKWPSMNDKGLFLVDTAQLEKMGHVRKDAKKSCLENEMNTDAEVTTYLKHLTH